MEIGYLLGYVAAGASALLALLLLSLLPTLHSAAAAASPRLNGANSLDNVEFKAAPAMQPPGKSGKRPLRAT